MDESGRIRVSDAEREAVVVQLTTATAEGRLTLGEFEERAGRAYGSRVRRDLAGLVDDLPPAAYHPVPPAAYHPVPPMGYRALPPAAHRPVWPLVEPPVSDPVNNVARVGMLVGFGTVLAGATAPPLAFFTGVAAIVLGVLGLRDAREDPELGGQAEAWAGIATGVVGFVLMLVMIFALDWLDI